MWQRPQLDLFVVRTDRCTCTCTKQAVNVLISKTQPNQPVMWTKQVPSKQGVEELKAIHKTFTLNILKRN